MSEQKTGKAKAGFWNAPGAPPAVRG